MRVLVIGGTGFVGPHVVRRLRDWGHEVAVFHRGDSETELPSDVRHLHGDRDRLLEHRDSLLALRPELLLDMVATNERHARDLMALFGGVVERVVGISSQDVYRVYGRLWRSEPGPPVPVPLDEGGPLRERLYPHRGLFPGGDDYDKIPVETLLMAHPDTRGTILRLPMVYGPHDRQHRLHPFLKRMDDRRPAILLDQRQAGWRWSRGYSENVGHAIALAVHEPRAAGRIYNVAEEPALSMTEWVERIGRAAGWSGRIVALPPDRLPVHLAPPTDVAGHDFVVTTARIREELAYAEPIPPDEALHRTVAWARVHPPAEVDPTKFDYAAEDAALARL